MTGARRAPHRERGWEPRRQRMRPNNTDRGFSVAIALFRPSRERQNAKPADVHWVWPRDLGPFVLLGLRVALAGHAAFARKKCWTSW